MKIRGGGWASQFGTGVVERGLRYLRTGGIGLFLIAMIASFVFVLSSLTNPSTPTSTPPITSAEWRPLASTNPQDVLRGVRATHAYQEALHATQTTLGQALRTGTLGAPVLVHAYRPKPGTLDVWVIPVLAPAGATASATLAGPSGNTHVVALLDFAFDSAHHRIRALTFAGPFVPSDPEYNQPFPRISATTALATVARIKGAKALLPGAQPQLIYFAADLDRLNAPNATTHWTGGGQFPDLAIWYIPGATSANASRAPTTTANSGYIVGIQGAVYTPDQLPYAA